MAISNWNTQAIIDHLYAQIDAAKVDIGLKEVSKGLRTNILEKEDVKKFIATRQQPFLYITLAPGATHPMEDETEAGVEITVRIVFYGFLEEKKSEALLKDRVDGLIENLLDYVKARDEFRGGLVTRCNPVSYVSTEEALFPYAFFQLDFDFTFTWIKE